VGSWRCAYSQYTMIINRGLVGGLYKGHALHTGQYSLMNNIPGSIGLTSRVYDCNRFILTASEYIVSRGMYTARQFHIVVRGITTPQIKHNTDYYSQHLTLPYDASQIIFQFPDDFGSEAIRNDEERARIATQYQRYISSQGPDDKRAISKALST
jgi:hypothetical protein